MSKKWSRKKIIQDIQNIGKKKDYNLIPSILQNNNNALYYAAIRYFGSWRKAVIKAGYNYDDILKKKRYWSKEKIIQDIQNIREKNKDNLVYSIMKKNNYSLLGAAVKYFGSWRKAVTKAGYNYDDTLNFISWSKKKIIQDIQEIGEKNKKNLAPSIMKENSSALLGATVKYFGSLRNAVIEAGYDYDDVLKKVAYWPKEKIIQDIQDIGRKNKDNLTFSIMKKNNNALLGAGISRFGSWKKAVTKAGYDYDNIIKVIFWSKKKIIQDIQDIGRKNKDNLVGSIMKRNNNALYYAAIRYFGSWRKAVTKAGYNYDDTLSFISWSKKKIIQDIQDIGKSNKCNLTVLIMRKNNCNLYNAAKRFFSSWEEAIIKSGYEYNDILKTTIYQSKEKTIQDIQDIGRKNKDNLAGSIMKKNNSTLYSTAIKYFGSWEKAIVKSGYNYDDVKKNIYWSKKKIVQGIQDIGKNNKDNLAYSIMKKNNFNLYNAATKYFGSWKKAVTKAGYNYDDTLNFISWSKKKIIQDIQEIGKNNKDNLVYSIIQRNNSTLSDAARMYFGSWKKAVTKAGYNYDDILLLSNNFFSKGERKSKKYKGKDNHIYFSIVEGLVGDYIFDLKNKNIIETYKRQVKITKERNWSCDFVVKFDNRKIWLEVDGMGKNRKKPYSKNHPKIKYYIDNNFDYKIVKNIKETKLLFEG